MTLSELSFSLPELLSLLGLAQVVYVLVYMGFRAGNLRTAALPFLYFLCLGFAFLTDFAGERLQGLPNFDLVQWFFWYASPSCAVLLIMQVARLGALPAWRELWVLTLPPLALAVAFAFASFDDECRFPGVCTVLRDWLSVTGLIAGALSLTALWPHRADLHAVATQKGGAERYWLILTIIIVNLFLIGFMSLMGLTMAGTPQALLVRTITGVTLIYLAGTSLFRIYPLAMPIKDRAVRDMPLKEAEKEVEARLRNLIELEKVYHEPSYSRSDLARELAVPENTVSRIVGHAYGRTVPQLINERRVEDAKRLLAETDAAVRIISEDVGFNSVASFNRVFRDMAGQNPTDYRNSQKKR